MLELKFNKSNETYLVEFSGSSPVVKLLGDIPQNKNGFKLSRVGKDDRWDYSDYKTIYRVLENGIQFSNNGSVYVPPTKSVAVGVNWDDGDNVKEIRPESVEVNVSVNGEFLEKITLDESNGWRKAYTEIPLEDAYTVELVSEVVDYTSAISGTTVILHTDYPVPEELTIEDLAEALTELCEVVEGNSGDITDVQVAVTEIYEMIGE